MERKKKRGFYLDQRTGMNCHIKMMFEEKQSKNFGLLFLCRRFYDNH